MIQHHRKQRIERTPLAPNVVLADIWNMVIKSDLRIPYALIGMMDSSKNECEDGCARNAARVMHDHGYGIKQLIAVALARVGGCIPFSGIETSREN